jgi:hypothetical protein
MEKNIGRPMEKYRAPSRAMIVAMETIGQAQEVEERKARLTYEDQIFADGVLEFEEGTVICVSLEKAINTRWTKRKDQSWDNQDSAKLK